MKGFENVNAIKVDKIFFLTGLCYAIVLSSEKKIQQKLRTAFKTQKKSPAVDFSFKHSFNKAHYYMHYNTQRM